MGASEGAGAVGGEALERVPACLDSVRPACVACKDERLPPHLCSSMLPNTAAAPLRAHQLPSDGSSLALPPPLPYRRRPCWPPRTAPSQQRYSEFINFPIYLLTHRTEEKEVGAGGWVGWGAGWGASCRGLSGRRAGQRRRVAVGGARARCLTAPRHAPPPCLAERLPLCAAAVPHRAAGVLPLAPTPSPHPPRRCPLRRRPPPSPPSPPRRRARRRRRRTRPRRARLWRWRVRGAGRCWLPRRVQATLAGL